MLITDRERVKEIILVNTGNKTNTYRLSFKDMVQGVNGVYQKVGEGGFEFSASEYIRFSPRQVSLKAGERQTVKLLVRRGKDMQPGDYRSHLSFVVLPSKNGSETAETQGNQQLGIKLTTLLSYSIPVVIQTGEPDVEIGLTGVQLKPNFENNAQSVDVQLMRRGKNGVFGKIELFAGNTKEDLILIGELNNANIFRESQNRVFNVNLNNRLKISEGDHITVKYTDVGLRKELLNQTVSVLSE